MECKSFNVTFLAVLVLREVDLEWKCEAFEFVYQINGVRKGK